MYVYMRKKIPDASVNVRTIHVHPDVYATSYRNYFTISRNFINIHSAMMARHDVEIRFNLKGTKRAQNISVDEAAHITWSTLLTNVSIDSQRVRLIVEGSLIRDMAKSVAEFPLRSNRINVLILPENDYNPPAFTPLRKETDGRTSNPEQIQPGISCKSPEASALQADYVDKLKHEQVREIAIGTKTSETNCRVINVHFGTRKFRVKCYEVETTLRSVAEALAVELHARMADIIFLHRGQKYSAKSFGVSIHDLPQESSIVLMLNGDHWDDDRQRIWLHEQLKALGDIEVGIRDTVGRTMFERDISSVTISWKRKLEEVEMNIRSYSVDLGESSANQMLERIRADIDRLKRLLS